MSDGYRRLIRSPRFELFMLIALLACAVLTLILLVGGLVLVTHSNMRETVTVAESGLLASAAVHSDCHVRAGHAWYSVPYRYVGARLEVRLGERLVIIYDGASLVATQLRCPHYRSRYDLPRT